MLRSLIVLGILFGGARVATASCDGCCHLGSELLGWSKDGKTIMVKETVDGESQIAVYTENVEQARWGGGPECSDPKPPMPSTAYATYKIEKLDTAWRTAFQTTFKIREGKGPYKYEHDPACTSSEVIDGTGKVVGNWLRTCDPDLTSCATGSIVGGYVHPSGTWLVMKTVTRGCGYRSSQRYKLVKLPAT